LGQTLIRLGSDLGQTLVRLGSDFGQTWVGHGSDLGQNWVRIGSELGQNWVRLGSGAPPAKNFFELFFFAKPLSGQKRSNPAQPKAIQPNTTKNDQTQPNQNRSNPSQAKNDPSQAKPTPSRQNNTPKKDKFPFKLSYAKTTQHLDGGLGKRRT